MGDRDNGGFDDLVVTHNRVFDLDAGDPLAAALDEVVHPVDYVDVPLRTHPDNVTGLEPAVVGDGLFGCVGRCSTPVCSRATHPEFAQRLAVPGYFLAVGVDDLNSSPAIGSPASGSAGRTAPLRQIGHSGLRFVGVRDR